MPQPADSDHLTELHWQTDRRADVQHVTFFRRLTELQLHQTDTNTQDQAWSRSLPRCLWSQCWSTPRSLLGCGDCCHRDSRNSAPHRNHSYTASWGPPDTQQDRLNTRNKRRLYSVSLTKCFLFGWPRLWERTAGRRGSVLCLFCSNSWRWLRTSAAGWSARSCPDAAQPERRKDRIRSATRAFWGRSISCGLKHWHEIDHSFEDTPGKWL